ncbi:MAG: signal peptidase II [Myxococcota bacterium]|nr:signal peptidase II [Myxococcota bacterium]
MGRIDRRIWRAVIFIAILASTTGFDYSTKEWARSELTVHQPRPVIEGFWDWELAFNDGAAFSSFRGSQVLLSLIALGALVMLGVMAHRTRPEQHLKRMALAMIAGGALGNLIDRVRDGAVTDFVRWQAGGHTWPIFNVADAALLVGVLMLLVDGFLERRAVRA